MDTLSRALLVPWIMTYLNYCCDTTWTEAVFTYGLFYASLKIGGLVGTGIGGIDSIATSKFPLILIAMSYGGLAMTTRISLLLVFAFIMGYAGAVVNHSPHGRSHGSRSSGRSSSSGHLHHHQMMDLAGRLISGGSGQTTTNIPEIGNETNAQRRIIIFAFAVLLSGMIWREGEHVYSVSLKMPSLLMAGFCLLIAVIKTYVNKQANNKRKPMTSSSYNSVSSSSGGAGNSGGNAMSSPMSPQSDVEASMDNIPPYHGGVPVSFLKLHKGNLVAAQQAYAQTLRWREIYHVDELLMRPQPFFEAVLKYYPHAIHGRSKDGCIVLYEVLGKAKPKELNQLEGNKRYFDMPDEYGLIDYCCCCLRIHNKYIGMAFHDAE
jgi:hypothetical protein